MGRHPLPRGYRYRSRAHTRRDDVAVVLRDRDAEISSPWDDNGSGEVIETPNRDAETTKYQLSGQKHLCHSNWRIKMRSIKEHDWLFSISTKVIEVVVW